MDQRLTILIDDYLASVSSAVKLLVASGIARPSSCAQWAIAVIDKPDVLLGGINFYKHGFGCEVHLKGGIVDFDFGENGEINGFDLWRLAGFAGDKLEQYGFASEEETQKCFESAVTEGALVRSAYSLYYLVDDIVTQGCKR